MARGTVSRATLSGRSEGNPMTDSVRQSTGRAGSLCRRRLLLHGALAGSAALFGGLATAAQNETLRQLADRKGFTIGALCDSQLLFKWLYQETLVREFNVVSVGGFTRVGWVRPPSTADPSPDL